MIFVRVVVAKNIKNVIENRKYNFVSIVWNILFTVTLILFFYIFLKMKPISLVLPVGDLLRHVGTQDQLTLDHIVLDTLPELLWGVSMTCQIMAVNNQTVYVRLLDLSTIMQAICDKCFQPFEKEIFVPLYEARFGLPIQINKHTHSKYVDPDYDFEIDEKNETIDVSECIYQAIVMESPIISYCNNCKSDIETDAIIDEYDLYA
jgi:uncharacterized metal-binding protein YceD (DUF177 family)